MMSKPYPALPKSLSERGELNSEKYIEAEDAILGIESEMQYLDQLDFADDRMEDIRELLADEPDPDWSFSPAWEELGASSQPLHETLKAIAVADFATACWEEDAFRDISSHQYRLALTNGSRDTTARSRPQSARSKRPSSAGSSRPGLSSRPGSARSSRAKAECPQPSCWPRQASIVAASSKVVAMQRRAAALRAGRQPCQHQTLGSWHRPKQPSASRRSATVHMRPRSAGSQGSRNNNAQSMCEVGGRASPAPRLTSALLQHMQRQPPQLVTSRGPVKAFAFSSSLNPRHALLEAARSPGPKMPGRPCTPGRPSTLARGDASGRPHGSSLGSSRH